MYVCKHANNGVDILLYNIVITVVYMRIALQLVWMESPTNPCMRVADLKKISTIIHNIRKDIIIVVDNTFQTSYFQVKIVVNHA